MTAWNWESVSAPRSQASASSGSSGSLVITASLTPCPLNPVYGFMWWLNTGRGSYAGASPESFFALGSGGNISWVDPVNDIVAVLRWTDVAAANEFMAGVTGALTA